MGNKLGRIRQVVDEKYTRPQGLYQHKDVDHKKLRKLILDSKLAPCYPGDEESSFDLEECPICFLYYPSLNRSRCCTKGICTECFLQMKPPHSTRPTQCPFCKTPNYAVEFRGVKTKEEKGMEELEEQKVIEAKIRMQQQELLEERMQKKHDVGSSSRIVTLGDVEFQDASSSSLEAPSFNFSTQGDEISPHEPSPAPAVRRSSVPRHAREEEFDLDLEDIMVMEAIWLSIQEHGSNRRTTALCNNTSSEQSVLEDHCSSPATTPIDVSPSGGLACAIAAMAERQHLDGHSSNGSSSALGYGMPQSGGTPANETVPGNYPHESWIDVSSNSETETQREGGEWPMDQRSDAAVVDGGYSSLGSTMEAEHTLSLNRSMVDHIQPPMARPILPESFEEQMMLAMAVSLADARPRPSAQPLAWQSL